MHIRMNVVKNDGPRGEDKVHDIGLQPPPKAAGGDANDTIWPGRAEGNLHLVGVSGGLAEVLPVGAQCVVEVLSLEEHARLHGAGRA